MIRDTVLQKRLEAMISSDEVRLPMAEQTALCVIRVMVPHLLKIIKEEIAAAEREWLRVRATKERQQ